MCNVILMCYTYVRLFVHSFGVVVWELLTRELPYNGMDLYAVAWGVGSGKLSLPVPDAAPELLRSLLNGKLVKV